VRAQAWPVADASVLAPVPEHDDLRKVMRDILCSHATHEQVRRAADSPPGWSSELWTLLNDEMNVGALAVAENRGGLGFGVAELAVVLEEAGRALIPEPVLPSAVLGARAVLAAPPGGLPDEVVGAVLEGRLVATVAGEPHAQADLVVSEDAGALTLTGRIARVVLGGSADLVVVQAGPPGGKSLYLVDVRDEAVVRRRPLEVLDLTRRQASVELVAAPAYLVTGPERTEEVLAELATLQRIALAAEHVGMVDAMLDLTRTYATQRHQFGRALASFQVIKHRLADVLVDLERSRSAARYAAAVFDQDPSSAELPSAVAASGAPDVVFRVAPVTVQRHGGIGVTWEHSAHYYLRRALADEAVFGSARAHRALVADLLGV
jgi:acyl-CoA dehydrogenase